MFRKKILAFLCLLAIVTAIGITAFTVFADDNNPNAPGVSDSSKEGSDNESSGKKNEGKPNVDFGKRFKKNLTDEDKARFEEKRDELKAKMDAARDKWSSLTDAQKSEIYGLRDKIADLEGQLADKYKDFGIISEEAANKIKERISERNNEMKKDGRMPMFGKGRMKCRLKSGN